LGGTREWDAGTYDRVSTPQLEWGESVLGRLSLRGDETVLDAGCGSGRVTELLVEALPDGRVIAVDGSAAMVAAAAERFAGRERVELIHSDLLELELDGAADAVFSNATFHWIGDHERLFARINSWLRAGGRLEAQCGGQGNVARFLDVVAEVAAVAPYAEHLADVPAATNFADTAVTERRLRAAGFERVKCWLQPLEVTPPEPRSYLRSVCLGPHLALLPESLRRGFVDAVHEAWGPARTLDYVRLNVSGRKGPES
jgi:trans-aconitate 2-methyltransferase